MDLSELTSIERLPPQNLDAEQAVLGSMLLEESAILAAAEHLDEPVFYKDAHRKIFAALLALYKATTPVDLITVTDELKRRNQLEEVGGASYLATLTSIVPTAANAEYYCRIVKQKAILRDLIRVSTRIAGDCYEEAVEPDVLLDRAEMMIFDIASKKLKRDAVAMKDIIKSSIEMIDTLYQRKGMITGMPTGFLELDQQLAGLQPAELIVVAGRPAMGKSSFTLCVAEHVAMAEKAGVAIFSLEMSKESLVQRMLCSHARINAHNVRSGMLSTSDWPNLTKAAGKLSEAPIFIDDSPSVSILELRARARRLKSRHNIGLVIVDYLQLMESRTSDPNNRVQEVAQITRGLKSIARELNIPVLALSQLSRQVEMSKPAIPKLAHLRESGSIEQDADVVMFIYRKAADKNYRTDDLPPEERHIAEIHIAKHRNGPTGMVKLYFDENRASFRNLSKQDLPAIPAARMSPALGVPPVRPLPPAGQALPQTPF